MLQLVLDKAMEKRNRLTECWYKLERKREARAQQSGLIQELDRAKQDLCNARSNFNFATDPALVEYFIYEMKAAETKLNYFLCRAKQEQLQGPNIPSVRIYERYGERSLGL